MRWICSTPSHTTPIWHGSVSQSVGDLTGTERRGQDRCRTAAMFAKFPIALRHPRRRADEDLIA